MRWKALVLVASLFLGSASAGTGTGTQPVLLEIKSSYGSTSPSGRAVEAFVARANELSSGAMRLSISRTDSYGNAFAVVKSGAAALATFEAPAVSGIDPLFSLSAFPMLAASFEEAWTLVTVARKHYESSLAHQGQRLLLVKLYQPVLLWSKAPIESKEDLAGLNAYASRRDWYATLSRLGVVEMRAAAPELLVAGPRNPNVAVFGPTMKHAIEVFWALPHQFITANAASFAALPAAAREALLAAAKAEEAAQWNGFAETARRDYADAAAKGITVQLAPPEALIQSLREAARPDVVAWTAEIGTRGSQILEEYRRIVGRP